MGRASQALKQVLDTYGISQNQLAGAMGIERGSVSRWYHEKRDPTAETVVEIVEALKRLNFQAAEKFVILYLGDVLTSKD
ncbi:MAG: XRE family transcriptional regulator [Leptolyngbya sp.]|nr:MAG: XRE family transcriptional regulator [Leptolyngbya sp.]